MSPVNRKMEIIGKFVMYFYLTNALQDLKNALQDFKNALQDFENALRVVRLSEMNDAKNVLRTYS